MAEALYQHLAGLTEEELARNLRSAHWRLRNLYYILDKDANTVLFVPNLVQERFLEEIWYRNVVPKARQRGFSTVVQLLILDACLFNANIGAGIIAQDDNTAKGIRNNKIKFAYDRLPGFIRTGRRLIIDNVTEMQWDNGSFLIVATSTRGRTLQYLHVSEYGKICAKYPDKAAEIKSGSLPSVDMHGIVVIESTAEGNEGDFYDKCRKAEADAERGRPLQIQEYRLHFTSWWDADEYEADPEHVVISDKDRDYFARIEATIGRDLSPRKRAWYVNKRDNDFSGDQELMWQEYPSTLEEAFKVSAEGKWLANQMALARRQGRITRLPYDPTVPVDTWWDLGVDDDIAIWFSQQIGPWTNFLWFLEGSGEPYSWFVRQMQERGYVWGKHYLPHDGAHRRPGSEMLKTSADMLADLGLRNIEIVPRTHDRAQAINELREDFGNYRFDEEGCAEGLKHLDGYSKEWNERLQVYTSEPRRDGHQHAADAIRQRAQMRHLFKAAGAPKRSMKINRSGMVV